MSAQSQNPDARLRSVCRALLALNLIYCSVALVTPGLPGWKMFEAVERLDYRLQSAEGKALNVHEVLPKGAHLIDHQQLRRVVTFLCERSSAPLWFEPKVGEGGRWLNPESCRADVAR